MIIASASYPITEHAHFNTWRTHVEQWVMDAVKQKAGLLLFPEYGAMELVSVFSDDIRHDIRRQVIELDFLKNEFCSVFSDLAKKYKVIIVAPSIPVIEAGKNVNRVYVFSEKGLSGHQDKFFMTRFENEEWGIQSGTKNLTLFEASWGTFGIQICYDVEFALGSHLLSSNGASLILAPSCTETIRGATRVHIGARARALENQVYTVVSQTVGNALWSPAVDINYGFSACYATPDTDMPEEGIIATLAPQKEGWLIQELDFTKIQNVRDAGQVFNFQDHQHLHMSFKNEEIAIIRQSV
ncbi:carbon-nitrogen hydrolase family protein [Dyadobacter sp. LHD-138]|uniref:carbon-nitrogen hydrolase family protein n=1 Tax=Dyadobacter sp. LHD-138 TaxID=3071413 RepID=UPI0027DED790|nr:carbon-nitrogen hydrolase family protein [Dyadobacter sp. LHD-138]MDQ6480256.1 carbon-nitrogen hydrolase family protein [Dyadobacter sp. LHD-138]